MRFLIRIWVLVLLAACGSTGTETKTTHDQLEASSTTATPDEETTVTTTSETTTTSEEATTTTEPPQGPALVAYYPLDGSAEDVKHPSGDWDGEVFGALPTEDRFGSPDSAYLFDGFDDFIEARERLAAPSTGFDSQVISIAAWISMSAAPRELFWWWDVVSYGSGGHVLAVQGRGAPLGGVQGSGKCEYMTEDNILDGQWHHIAMTRDQARTIFIYLDGEPRPVVPHLDQTRTPTETGLCDRAATFDWPIWIGGDPVFDEYFEGSIDEVRIYNYALTPDEVQDLANQK